jgi:hypothetical protein
LPNVNCLTSVFQGDPSVEVYQTGGDTYFYLSSLFFDANSGAEKIAMDVCRVVPGSLVSLSCNPNPIIIADPGVFGFDDKDFLSIDAARGLLYATYLLLHLQWTAKEIGCPVEFVSHVYTSRPWVHRRVSSFDLRATGGGRDDHIVGGCEAFCVTYGRGRTPTKRPVTNIADGERDSVAGAEISVGPDCCQHYIHGRGLYPRLQPLPHE